jgi:hypothetical protein
MSFAKVNYATDEVEQTSANREKPKLAFGIDDLEEASGFGRSTIYEQIKAGNLRARKLGRRTFVMADDAKAWLQGLPEKNGG